MFLKNYYNLVEDLHAIPVANADSIYVKSAKQYRTISGETTYPYVFVRGLYDYGANPKRLYPYCQIDGAILNPGSSYAGCITGSEEPSISYTAYEKCFLLVLGDGDAPPTLDDYYLSGNRVSTLNTLQTKHTRTAKNGVSTWECTLVLQNTGEGSVTIKEVCALAALANGITYNSSRNLYAIERTVLENPVTIEPGNTGTITYRLTTAYPTPPTE